MSRVAHLHLFEGYGIELEYMIVAKDTLGVSPISDLVLRDELGDITEEVAFAETAWSNELVLHVIELKTNGPTAELTGLAAILQRDVNKINAALARHHAMLMPTAMHPLMDPESDTKLWPHGDSEIYDAYNKIFDCRGHGWSNLQSIHINLPFANDAEFGRLHAAIRLALPLLPALAASSPIYLGKPSGIMDSRLEFYRNNQATLPLITGKVIPEQAFSRREYEERIFKRIYEQIRPHDPAGILQYEWLNSRGAIARFDRNAIEIRVLDIQESPRADLAVIAAVVSLVRALVEERWISYAAQKKWEVEPLQAVFLECLRQGDAALIKNAEYLRAMGLEGVQECTAQTLWQHLCNDLVKDKSYPAAAFHVDIDFILTHGCLARRILSACGAAPTLNRLKEVYRELCTTLAEGRLFAHAQV